MNDFVCSECGTKYQSPETTPPPGIKWSDGHVCTPKPVNNADKKIEGVTITMNIDPEDLASENEVKTLLVDFYGGDIPTPPIIAALKALVKQLEEDEE